jgi:chloramphenicol-sensitive protein RarD
VVDDARKGLLFGVGAYLCWGLFPLYWPLLEPSGSVEVLAHPVVWSLVACLVLVAATRRRASVLAVLRDGRLTARLALAAVLIALNWGLFIYGVTSEQVVETSLGYFINPLVTVALGVVVLGERLRPVQWAALGGAAVAVLVLTVENGRPPWLALALAASFAGYGLLKKTAGVPAVEGLSVETLVLAPVALGYLVLTSGDSTFVSEGPGHLALLVCTGVVTAVPLLLFAGAAARVPLTTVGLLQYVTPTMQFLIGVLVYDEAMPVSKLLGFTLVWASLAVFTYDVLAHRRRVLVPELV